MERYIVDGVMLEVRDSGEVLAVATVTEQNGSWKYQKAFRRSRYTIRFSTRQHRHFWKVVERSRKFAQGPKIGYSYAPAGSLHNRPVSATVLQAVGLLSQGDYEI